MNSRDIFIISVLILGLGFFINTAIAAEEMPVDPNVKVLLGNDDVRVAEAVRPPGTIVPMHTHPAYVAYFFDAWKGKITNAKGEVKEKEFAPEDVLYSPGVTHALEVVGTTDQHVLVIEWEKK
jgi:quercetin dioxygenase-like cupin family protein